MPKLRDDLPFVSVVMPVRNEAAYIARSLAAVLQQDYPEDRIEVVVADGISSDGTREVVAGFALRDRRVRLVDNPRGIAPTGLNAAIRASRGSIVIRVDGHCEVARDYVTACVRHLASEEIWGVGGPIETKGETDLATAIAVAMSTPFGVGGSKFRTVDDRTMLVDTVAFPAYPRWVLERCGLFDEELVRNQDDEYNSRIRKAGGKILLTPDVRSRYYSRGTLRSLWRQYFQYGFWKVRVMQKHPKQMRPRHFVPSAVVGALVLSMPFLFLRPWGWVVPAFLLGTYTVANLSASLISSAGLSKRFATRLPLIFAILHLSYGAGSCVGMLRFAARWGDAGSVPTLPLRMEKTW